MGRAARFIVVPTNGSGFGGFPEVGILHEAAEIDKAVAALTRAYAIENGHTKVEPAGERLPLAWSFAFAVGSSVVLWTLIARIVVAIVSV